MTGHTQRQWEGKFFRCQMACWYCRIPLTLAEATKDHLTPLARGGRDSIDNIVAACLDCNQLKGELTEEEFRTVRKQFSTAPEISPASAFPEHKTVEWEGERFRIVGSLRRKRTKMNRKQRTQRAELLLQPDPKQRSLQGQYLLWPDCAGCSGSGWRIAPRTDGKKGAWAIRCACRKQEPERFDTDAERHEAIQKRRQPRSEGIAVRDAAITLLGVTNAMPGSETA